MGDDTIYRRNAVENETANMNLKAVELAEWFILTLVTGMGIYAGSRLLSIVWPVVTANRFDQAEPENTVTR